MECGININCDNIIVLNLKCKDLAGGKIGTWKTRDDAVQLENLDILFGA